MLNPTNSFIFHIRDILYDLILHKLLRPSAQSLLCLHSSATLSVTHTPSPFFFFSLAERKAPSSVSALSQPVRVLPWRLLDLKFVPAVALLVAPTGRARSQWTPVSKLSQSLHRNPTHLFLHNVCQSC